MVPRVTQPLVVNSRSVPWPLSPQGCDPLIDNRTVPVTTWALTPGTSLKAGWNWKVSV